MTVDRSKLVGEKKESEEGTRGNEVFTDGGQVTRYTGKNLKKEKGEPKRYVNENKNRNRGRGGSLQGWRMKKKTKSGKRLSLCSKGTRRTQFKKNPCELKIKKNGTKQRGQ